MHSFAALAKKAVENYVIRGKTVEIPKNFSKDALKKKAGVFVTITKGKELRGCIGTYLPTRDNIAEEIIENAVSAAVEDYRFNPVAKDELPHLSYAVYILGEPAPVKDIKELDPKKFGMIVKTQGARPKCGILLPDLEGVDTAEDQFSICCQKGGIDPEQEFVSVYGFSTEKYV